MKGLPAVGMLVQRVGEKGPVQRERILYLDRAGDLVVVIALDDDEAMPRLTSARDFDRLWREDQLKLCDDEFALLSGAKVKHVAKMDRNWTAIQKIVESEPGCFDPDIRDDLLAQAKKADKGGRARKTLLRDLRRYWQSGKQKEALATHYSRAGAPGQERISDEVKKAGRRTILEQHGRVDRGLAVNPDVAKIFDTYLKKYVLKREPLTVSATYRKMIDEKFSTRHRNPAGRLIVDPLPQDSRPSERQFRYYANKRYGISAKKKAQDGVEGYEQTTRPVLGNSTLLLGPGFAFQIDATETDTQLVNSILRERPIGRANHYFTTDAFSAAIAGIHVALESPSVLMVRQTLANASSSKVAFCKQLGIAIEEEEWPCHHFPSSLIADRGEVIAKSVDIVVDELQLKVTNLPAYRPDWKPFVEGNFALANHVLHTLPGAVRRDDTPRKKDSRLEAVLDLFGITKVLAEFALYYNPHHILKNHPFDRFEIQSNVRPRPLDLWRWGVLHRSGALRVKSEEAIRMLLLERAEATVTGYGLRFGDADYDCSTAHEQEWFQRARTQGTWKVPVCFDRRNLEYIFLLPEGRRALVACPLLRRDKQMVGLSLEDIEDFAKFRELRDALMREDQLKGKVNLHARVEEVVESQRKLTHDRKKAAPVVSKNAAKKGVREYRNEERGRENAKIHKDVAVAPSSTKATVPSVATTSPDPGSATTSLADFREARRLQALRERRQNKP